MKPGLKLLTPDEVKKVSKTLNEHLARWMMLFHPSRNKWRPIK